jgi:hypothetical protein
MLGGADAGGTIGELAGPSARERDQLGHALRRDVVVDDQDVAVQSCVIGTKSLTRSNGSFG